MLSIPGYINFASVTSFINARDAYESIRGIEVSEDMADNYHRQGQPFALDGVSESILEGLVNKLALAGLKRPDVIEKLKHFYDKTQVYAATKDNFGMIMRAVYHKLTEVSLPAVPTKPSMKAYTAAIRKCYQSICQAESAHTNLDKASADDLACRVRAVLCPVKGPSGDLPDLDRGMISFREAHYKNNGLPSSAPNDVYRGKNISHYDAKPPKE